MNLKIEKKEYEAPKMTVVEMEADVSLLAGSCESDCVDGDDGEDGVFDFN